MGARWGLPLSTELTPGPDADAPGPNTCPFPEPCPISSVYELSWTLLLPWNPGSWAPTASVPVLFSGSSGLLPGWHWHAPT